MNGLPICPECFHEIVEEICWCGDLMNVHHHGSGHNPVPMGCTCGYADQPKDVHVDTLVERIHTHISQLGPEQRGCEAIQLLALAMRALEKVKAQQLQQTKTQVS